LTSTTTNATRSPARGPNAPESYQAPARTPSHRFRIAHPSPALPPRPICSQPQAATKQQLQDQAFPPPPFFCPIYRTGHAPREALDLALAPETCRQPTLDVPLQTWKPSRRFPLDTPLFAGYGDRRGPGYICFFLPDPSFSCRLLYLIVCHGFSRNPAVLSILRQLTDGETASPPLTPPFFYQLAELRPVYISQILCPVKTISSVLLYGTLRHPSSLHDT
jgi:hypothetical protein